MDNSSLCKISENLRNTYEKLGDEFFKKEGEIWYNFYKISCQIQLDIWIKASKICPNEFSFANLEKQDEEITYSKLKHKIIKINENQAVHIFKTALPKICYDKIRNLEDTYKFRELQKKIYVRTFDIDSLRRIPVRKVLDKLGVKHRRGFIYEEGKQTSAHIYEKNNRVHRFSGQAGGGDVIDVVQHYLQTDFKGAVSFLNNLI